MAYPDYFKVNQNEIPGWLPFTPGELGSAPSCYPTISDLELQYKRINALRLSVVGDYSLLYTSFPLSTGTEIMERVAEISASFVRLQTELGALLTTVKRAMDAANQQNTSTPGNKL
jgi:hypothetical protein